MRPFRVLTVGLAIAAAVFAATSCGGEDAQPRAQLTATGPPPSFTGQTRRPVSAKWHYQLQGRLRLSSARVYDIDGLDARARFVSRLRARGRYAICYVNAGAWENWRPDRSRFPAWILGRPNGWPGERWLDIRRIDVVGPIVRDRFETCRRKGFDAVEPDNVDGYANRTGFPLRARDQLRYNSFLARTAHRLGLAVGLKNDLGQVRMLEPRFDFAIVEQCFEFDECGKLRPFTREGKPVFEVEYNLPRSRFCPRAHELRFNAIRADEDLGGPTAACD